jgi:hypothetical protein
MLVNLQHVKESIASLLIEGEESLILPEAPYTFCVGPVHQDQALELADELVKISIKLTGIDSTFGRNVRKDEANPVIRFIVAAMSEEIPLHMLHWLSVIFSTTELKHYPGMPGQKLVFSRPRRYADTLWNQQHSYYFNYIDVEFRVKSYGTLEDLGSAPWVSR